MLELVSEVGNAKLAVLAAGGLIVGVLAASRAFDWIRNVIIMRDASQEYYDRYGR